MESIESTANPSKKQKHSVLDSNFPVVLPEHDALLMSELEFQAFVKKSIEDARSSESLTPSNDAGMVNAAETSAPSSAKSPFVQGLEKHAVHHRTAPELLADNLTLTANADVTNLSSGDPIVDLFYELGGNSVPTTKLRHLFSESWNNDPLLTLKIIFNARSIHLGKADRVAAYRAMGWLAEYHPLTLLANLRWLVRPVIGKKGAKPDQKKNEEEEDKNKKTEDGGDDEDFDMIDVTEVDPAKAHDVRYGVAHGYWKDLLNLVVFAANEQLSFNGDPDSLLHTSKPSEVLRAKGERIWDQATAKTLRLARNIEQNQKVQDKLNDDPFYRALHMTVARLFAEQLKEDKALLDSGKQSDLHKLSLAAKWAPTFSEFHDKHTFIVSSIAEILFPDPRLHCPDPSDRTLYLRHARELYRKEYVSPLRKALGVVERDIAAKKFENIKYDRVPSLAMSQYTNLFMKKDYERFKDYVSEVAKGAAKISGATLLPSTLVSKARALSQTDSAASASRGKENFKSLQAAAEAKIYRDVIDGQWNTLVKRVRDAGVLESSLAVCDVSGSMQYPLHKDGTCPMDSAIGLSMIIAEVTAAPFGGGFISFSERPTYCSMGGSSDARGLVDKVNYIMGTHWGYSTDFVAVFEDVILPMAVANKLKPEDMVKQVFVFSDMQFNTAQEDTDRWTTSYERIEQKYTNEGYDMPRLVFWNLAAMTADKPVTMDDVDTALVSGYSQGMLRAFLETGTFDNDEEVVEEELQADDDDTMMEVKKAKKKLDPLTVVKKAVAHKAYDMLEVVD